MKQKVPPSILLVSVATAAIPPTWGTTATAAYIGEVLRAFGLNIEHLHLDDADAVHLPSDGAFVVPNARQIMMRDGAIRFLADLLDERGIPYFGSSAAGLAAADKLFMKSRLLSAGLPTPRFAIVETGGVDHTSVLRYPVIVKPVFGAGSIGVTRVDAEEQLAATVAKIEQAIGQSTFVEEFRRVREFTVALLGNDPPRPYVVEIALPPAHSFLSESAKSTSPSTIGAVREHSIRRRLEALACDTFSVLRLRDWARIDITSDENDQLYVIDVNTQPGLGRPPGRPGLFAQSIMACTDASYPAVVGSLLGVGLRRTGIPPTAALERCLAATLAGRSVP